MQNVQSAVSDKHANETLLGSIWSMFMRKEIAEREFHAYYGAWVAENAHSYGMRQFTPLHSRLRQFCERRIAGEIGPDDATARVVTQWLTVTVRTRMDNEADMRSLEWAAEKCESVGLSDKAAILRRAISEAKSVGGPNNEDIRLVDRWLEVESAEKLRAFRGRAV